MEKEFLDILNSHRGLIFKVVNLYCADADDRQDLFQEIVFQAWKSLKTFRNESALSTWMYRIALNTAITHLRKEKRAEFRRLEEMRVDIPDFNENVERDERERHLLDAIATLDKIDRSIVLLFLDEKSYQEISDIMGISVSNVGVRLNRIKEKLSKKLKSVI